jgi:hypothetical protein
MMEKMGADAVSVASLPPGGIASGLAGGALAGGAPAGRALAGGAQAGSALAGSAPATEALAGGALAGSVLAGNVLAGSVLAGSALGDDVLPDAGTLPVLAALQDLLPGGGLQRGSVVATDGWSLLCLALAAAASAAGAWCAAVGLPQLGVRAAIDVGLDPRRLLLIGAPGPGWPPVVASLLDGCDIVLLCPPARLPASARRKLEATVRRHGSVLLVAGDWDGAQARLTIADQQWTGLGDGHGRLRARRVQVLADGRGAWSRPRARWLWLPGPDGSVATIAGQVAGEVPGLAVAAG